MAMPYLPNRITDRQSAGRDLDVVQRSAKFAAPVLLKNLPEAVNRFHEIVVVDTPTPEEFQSEDVRVGTRRTAGLNEVDVVNDQWTQADVNNVALCSSEFEFYLAIHKPGI